MAYRLVTTLQRFLGTAAERAAMTTTGVNPGSTYFETDTGLMYVLDNAGSWQAKKDNLAALPAGTALIGKVSIDQTTPGTTNAVAIAGKITATITTVNVGVASTQLLAANANRVYALFQDLSDTMIDINLGAAAVAGAGIRLAPGTATAPGGSFEMSMAYGNLDTRAVNAIHAGVGNKVMLIVEGVRA